MFYFRKFYVCYELFRFNLAFKTRLLQPCLINTTIRFAAGCLFISTSTGHHLFSLLLGQNNKPLWNCRRFCFYQLKIKWNLYYNITINWNRKHLNIGYLRPTMSPDRNYLRLIHFILDGLLFILNWKDLIS